MMWYQRAALVARVVSDVVCDSICRKRNGTVEKVVCLRCRRKEARCEMVVLAAPYGGTRGECGGTRGECGGTRGEQSLDGCDDAQDRSGTGVTARRRRGSSDCKRVVETTGTEHTHEMRRYPVHSGEALDMHDMEQQYYLGGAANATVFVFYWVDDERYVATYHVPEECVDMDALMVAYGDDDQSEQATFFDDSLFLVRACVSTTSSAPGGGHGKTRVVGPKGRNGECSTNGGNGEYVEVLDVTDVVRMLMGPNRDFHGRWVPGGDVKNMPAALKANILDLYMMEGNVVKFDELCRGNGRTVLVLMYGDDNTYVMPML